MGRIGLGAKAAGIAVGLPGTDIELPAVPGTADDLPLPGVFDLAGVVRLRQSDQRPLAQRGALMRAAIEQAEILALDVEHRDRTAIDGEEFAAAGWQLLDGRNDVTGHVICFARSRLNARSRSRQPIQLQ